jgi:WD40 repeat protein
VATPDAFISYAREDADFVKRLCNHLVAAGATVWVDTEDVPFSVSWTEKALAGIRAAKAFVFVLTPHSAVSRSCAFELEHAKAANKRLVPVALGTDLAPEDVPAAVAYLNWIRVVAGADLDGTVAGLVATLEADLPWREAHARLLVRAAEWAENRRDVSLLPRGSDLQAAEEWLDRRGAHEEQPTALQSEYILAGRRATSRRQRFALTVGVLALAVTMTLASLAYWQRNVAVENEHRAERQRAIAEREADTATSRRLAAEALGQAELDRSLLASLEAYRTARTAEARGALLTSLERSPRLRATLRGHRARTLVDDVVFAPGGMLLSVGEDGTLRRWDAARARPAGPPVRIGGKLLALALNPADGRTLAVASSAGTITLLDLDNPSPDPQPAGRVVGQVTDLAFAPDGLTLVSTHTGGRVRFWPVRRTRLGSPVVRRGDAGTIAFSPDGGTLATAGAENGTVALWNVVTRRVRGKLRARGVASISDLAFSGDGRTLAAAANSPAFWNWRTGRELPAVAGAPGRMWAVAFDPSGTTFAAAGDDGTLRLWDMRRRRPLGPPLEGHVGPAQALAFSPDGHELASAGTTDSAVRVWSARHELPLASVRADAGPGRGTATALSRDGHVLAAGDTEGNVTFRDAAGGQVHPTWEQAHRDAIADIALSDDGRRAASLDAGGAVRTWEVSGRRVLRSDLRAGSSAAQVALSPRGTVVVTTGFDLPAQSAPVAGSRPASLLERGSPAYGAAFSRDGRWLAVGLLSGIQLWHDGRRGTLIARSGADAVGESVALAVGPGDREVASGDAGGRVAIWAIRGSTEPKRVVRAHDGAVSALAFTSDGRVLVSAGADGTVTLTEVASGRRLGSRMPGPNATVDALAVTKAGALVSADQRGGVAVWDRLLLSEDLTAWRARVCRLTGRSLSREEWAVLVPGRRYRSTCG